MNEVSVCSRSWCGEFGSCSGFALKCCRKIGRLVFQEVTLRFFYFFYNFLSKISSGLSCHRVVVVLLFFKKNFYFFRIKKNRTKITGFILLWSENGLQFLFT